MSRRAATVRERFVPARSLMVAALRFQRISLLPPAADAAVHGEDVGIAHLLEVIRRQGRAEAATAVEHDLGRGVWDLRLHVSFEDASSQVRGVRKVILRPLALLAHINQMKRLAAIELLLDLIHGQFADARFDFLNQFQEPRGMLVGHDWYPFALVSGEWSGLADG